MDVIVLVIKILNQVLQMLQEFFSFLVHVSSYSKFILCPSRGATAVIHHMNMTHLHLSSKNLLKYVLS